MVGSHVLLVYTSLPAVSLWRKVALSRPERPSSSVWSQGQFSASPGGLGILFSKVQVPPPSLEYQIGAVAPQPPLKASTEISLVFAGLIAMLGSLLAVVLVFFRCELELLTTTSTNEIDNGVGTRDGVAPG